MLAGVRECPIDDALTVVGDRWSLLVVREIGFGVTRFNDIARHTGMARDRLASRLRSLETAGIIRREQYNERPPRHEYLLTEFGRGLLPVLDALRRWGDTMPHGAPATP